MGKVSEKRKKKKQKAKSNHLKQVFIKEKLEDYKFILKLKQVEKYINLYHKYILKKIDLLEFMDLTDRIIEESNISDKELKIINENLEKKFLEEKYTEEKILFEINILNNKELSLESKFTILNEKYNKRNNIRSDYSGDFRDKKIIPKDLRKYDRMNGVTSIIYNAVGTKR